MNLIKDLAACVPKDSLVCEQELLSAFECDGLSAYRQTPLAVVLPQSVEQVTRVIKTCQQHQTPIVTRGAGTGLSGGALPLADGVLLVLSKMNKILKVDPVKKIAVLEPGVRNLAISEAAEKHNLYYAPDPSSQIACSIGGNVAENAGGVHCLKYGLTVNNVLAVKVITIDGQLLELDVESNISGLDLLALLNGSEGLLGVVVEVTVKLLVKPEHTTLLMAGFGDIGSCATAVSWIFQNGIIPAGLEMMDKLAISAAEDFIHAGYPTELAALLLCELDGSKLDVIDGVSQVKSILEKAGAVSIKISASEAERLLLWQGRKAAFPAVGRIAPDYYCMDGTIPRNQLKFVLEEISKLSEKYALQVANVFHAGDGNLHPLILYDANNSGELEKAESLGAEILKLSVAVGGTITGEHGVGVEKLDSMCEQFGEDELIQFHALKNAFDNEGLLNPGKAVPTLHRCAELGAMHIHGGKLPFPEIDRF